MSAVEHIATDDEIASHVKQNDIPLTAKRSAAAQQVGELARSRAGVATQLDNIERELGDVLSGAQDVITVDELARFTGVPAEDLARWLAAGTTTRAKRKRPTTKGTGATSHRSERTRAAGRTTTPSKLTEPPAAAADTLTRVPAEVMA
jgi:hypothetical protein